MNICPAQAPDPHLPPPQANPATEPGTVGQRTQWAAEVGAYVADLQAQLDEIRRQG